jgi:Caspase domain
VTESVGRRDRPEGNRDVPNVLREKLLASLRFWVAWCLALAAAASTFAQSSAPIDGKRVALVIGNGAYGAGRLNNPALDARAMAATLRSLGFEVGTGEDMTYQGMRRAVADFGERMAGAAVALFYYAGHGLQVGGKNYLVPVDAEIKTELYVAAETVELNTVLGLMQDAKTRVNILIIDACRDNPFARRFRGVARGLAFMDAPNGTYVAYATAPGSVAEDGDPGQNSIYTGELIKVLREPGLRIEDVFKRVRVAVLARTNNRQNPWDASSLTGDFFLNAANPEEQRPTPRTVVWRWDHRSIPGPPSVDIRMPSADLPPVVGALSGVWDGAWDGFWPVGWSWQVWKECQQR